MNWDRIENEWQQVKSKVKAQWDKLTDDHLDKIGGLEKADAEHQVKTWENASHDVFAETAAEVQKHVGIARQ